MQNEQQDSHVISTYLPALRQNRDLWLTVLDVVEPLAPVIAGMLRVLQPAAAVVQRQQLIGTVARLLEDPEDLATFRRSLEQVDDDTTS